MKIILGAAEKGQDGWVSTRPHQLDLLDAGTWVAFGLEPNTVDALVAEHVWEHLSLDDGIKAAALCYVYLRPGGHLRIAVPDGFHPSKEYLDYVRPGGEGAGTETHVMLYDCRSLAWLLGHIGFTVRLLEYWDEAGTFHAEPWQVEDGYIERCAAFDPRNQDGQLHYTSLILDAVKP